MKLNIKRPSEYIRYVSEEDYRQELLRKAAPVWGKRVDKSAPGDYIVYDRKEGTYR